MAADQTLCLLFQNQSIPINKDSFVIGRIHDADLCIQHIDISRKHAIVQRSQHIYYMIDLASSGVYDNGMRVAKRKIEEGDVYHICDFEFTFTFQTRR